MIHDSRCIFRPTNRTFSRPALSKVRMHGIQLLRRVVIITSSHLLDYLAEVPHPVLFNTWKHHAAATRQRMRDLASGGDAALEALADELRSIGTDLMDLYTGELTPAAIAGKVLALLRADRRLELATYRAWLTASGGYGVLAFPEDGTQWVVRLGDEKGRYIHLHPARWAPETRRVRANVLKTAIMVQAHAAVHGGDPHDITRINAVRKRFLDLSPIGRLKGDDGLGIVLKELAVS